MAAPAFSFVAGDRNRGGELDPSFPAKSAGDPTPSKDGLSVHGKLCSFCCRAGPRFRCVCGTAYYCDGECQRCDWRSPCSPHHLQCRVLRLWNNDTEKEWCMIMQSLYNMREMTCPSGAVRFAEVQSKRLVWHEEAEGMISSECDDLLGHIAEALDSDPMDKVDTKIKIYTYLASCADAWDGMAVVLVNEKRATALLHYRHHNLQNVLSRCFLKCICGQKRGFKQLYGRFREEILASGNASYARCLRGWKFSSV